MAKLNGEKISDQRRAAFAKLNIAADQRLILSLDGGGMRGIMTIQLLKKLEEIAGMPCFELFDMVAGTSTGAIISGLILTGHTALQIEQLYIDLVTQVFDKRFLGDRYVNPPAYSKAKYRKLVKEIVGEKTLQDAVKEHDLDMMIISQDLGAAEATFFSCFQLGDDVTGDCYGTYKDVLLRAVMEATMSAPTYFYPLERFVDGGTTTYNNPSLAGYMEAVSFSTPEGSAVPSNYVNGKITIFSFGTGIIRQFVKPENTTGFKVNNLVAWLSWLMTQTGQDASAMQVNSFRSGSLNTSVDFRRYEISLDESAIKQLPDTGTLDEKKYGTKWLRQVPNEILHNIDMSDVDRFDLMKVIGEQMAQYIVLHNNNFQRDFVNAGNNDCLVSVYGDKVRINRQMSDADWLDGFKA